MHKWRVAQGLSRLLESIRIELRYHVGVSDSHRAKLHGCSPCMVHSWVQALCVRSMFCCCCIAVDAISPSKVLDTSEGLVMLHVNHGAKEAHHEAF